MQCSAACRPIVAAWTPFDTAARQPAGPICGTAATNSPLHGPAAYQPPQPRFPPHFPPFARATIIVAADERASEPACVRPDRREKRNDGKRLSLLLTHTLAAPSPCFVSSDCCRRRRRSFLRVSPCASFLFHCVFLVLDSRRSFVTPNSTSGAPVLRPLDSFSRFAHQLLRRR